MIADIGNVALMAALAFAVYALLSSILGSLRDNARLTESGQRAVGVVFAMVSLAMVMLITLLVTDKFHFAYVASESNRDLPLFYKIGSLWAGQNGSLLLWTWCVSAYSVAAVLTQKDRHNRLLPIATAVMMGTAVFFLCLNNFASNPFRQLFAVSQTTGATRAWAPADGNGLNPLLQNYWMVIHPPILYIGYTGFVVPFAFCVAALFTRQLGSAWVRTIRRWTLFTWLFLGVGIVMGAKWAYMELGWGGYWGWDPVENASLMPWLAGTAFLHSVILQEKRGMLKVWNVSLISVTYLLVILGTFLTRSGVVSSVHSFARSNIGVPFAIFILFVLAGTTALILSRLPYLKSENKLDSMVSRESGFLFNNLILLAATFSVLFGTVFPILSELFTGTNVTVGPAYFNFMEVPIGLLLLFLIGAGPLLAYRRTSGKSLRKNFTMPVVLGVVSAPVFFLLGVRGFWPMLSLVLCTFVTLTIVQEFHKGVTARRKTIHENYLTALVNLTRRNNRRYGGYIVHFAMVLVFLGATGSAFVKEGQGVIGEGESFKVGNYDIRLNEIRESEANPNYWSGILAMDVTRGGNQVARVYPEKRFYYASEQPTSEVAIHQSTREDLYLVFAGLNEDQTKAIVQAYVNPLVMWLWTGAIIMVLGTLVCLLPPLKGRSAA
jgi:cytochrome c-type biogenesis protein CcmF